MKKEDVKLIKELIIEALEDHEKNMELEELRKKTNEPKETAWLLMKKGLYENLIWFILDTAIWIGLLLWLGVF